MDNNFRAAQRAYDRQEPPEFNTNEDGECEHEWRVVRTKEIKGVMMVEYKCANCGKTECDV